MIAMLYSQKKWDSQIFTPVIKYKYQICKTFLMHQINEFNSIQLSVVIEIF